MASVMPFLLHRTGMEIGFFYDSEALIFHAAFQFRFTQIENLIKQRASVKAYGCAFSHKENVVLIRPRDKGIC